MSSVLFYTFLVIFGRILSYWSLGKIYLRIMILQTYTSIDNNYDKDFWALIISVSTLGVTLLTLMLTSFLNLKSARAAERSAKSSEKSAEFAEHSSSSAAESAKATADYVKITEKAVQISAQTFEIQREHNIKSVTPILSVMPLNHDEEISVKMINNGIGPLITTNIIVTNGVESNHDLISWMPAHPRGITYWKTYQKGWIMCISPGDSIALVFLENDDENFPDFVLYRAFVRRNLSKLRLTIEYKDIYNRPMESQTRDLTWFAQIGSRWFVENFPEDFNSNFNLSLESSKIICSLEEWENKLEKVKKDYTPNKLIEERSRMKLSALNHRTRRPRKKTIRLKNRPIKGG